MRDESDDELGDGAVSPGELVPSASAEERGVVLVSAHTDDQEQIIVLGTTAERGTL